MKMKIVADPHTYRPARAHPTDAGLDIRTAEEFTIMPHSSAIVNTHIRIELPAGTVGMLKSKSGLNVKHGITSEGVIDEGYTGEIIVRLYNHSDNPYTFHAGDKITQLVILPVVIPELEFVDGLGETERGDNGFGSSGK